MASHSLSYQYQSFKVSYVDSAGYFEDLTLTIQVDLVLNPANIDGDGVLVNTLVQGVIVLAGHSLIHSSLDILNSEIATARSRLAVQTLLQNHQTDYSYDWPGQGNTGSNPATNTLLTGAVNGSISLTYPGALP